MPSSRMNKKRVVYPNSLTQVHIIPRYVGDMEDSRGGVRGVIPEKQKY